MKFTKAYCGDNDFIIIDTRNLAIPSNFKSLIPLFCSRHKGIGANGIILIGVSDSADFNIRFFNPDASEYAVCGNGTLCALLYDGRHKTTFSTKIGVFTGEIKSGGKVKMQAPKIQNIKLLLPLNIKNKRYNFSFVDIGVPHTILFVDDINSVDVLRFGKAIRNHPHFGNDGTNVNFVQIMSKNAIAIRTYERGVEGETACGSGTCASGIVGWLQQALVPPVSVITKGGKLNLLINNVEDLWLEGSPKIAYKGEIALLKRKK